MYLTVFGAVGGASVHAQRTGLIPTSVVASSSPEQAVNYTAIAAQAFIYEYSLVTLHITEQQLTNVPAPIYDPAKGSAAAPINQFALNLGVPNSNFTAVVAPNADTLYSICWLDLSNGPMVLTVPNMNGRYYLMPTLDAWTDVFTSPGTRTGFESGGNFVYVGPNWNGTIPAGLNVINSPTDVAWILGRIEVNSSSTADIAAVNALQDQLKLTPLSAWGTSYVPPATSPVNSTVDMTTAPLIQVNDMASDPAKYFSIVAELMKDNPPYAADASFVAEMAQIGIVPGQPFNWSNMTSQEQSAILAGTESGLAQLQALVKSGGPSSGSSSRVVNGWLMTTGLGNYTNRPGMQNTFDDYMLRAYVSYVGLGANLATDAVYPQSRLDQNGQPYSGLNNYVLHFDSGQTPPYYGFWSLTMYNNLGFFVANPINRYAIGNRNPLQFNPDGSLDIYIQNTDPGPSKDSNWLPAPNGTFYVVMRIYWPQQSVLNGPWNPPPITLATTVMQSSTSTEMMSTSTTSSTATPGIPGFQVESIIIGIAVGLAAVILLRRRRQ